MRGLINGLLQTTLAAGMLGTHGIVGALPQSPGGLDADLRTILVRDLKFSAAELADLQRGKIVKHAIGTNVAGEVAVAGGVRIHASKRIFLDRLRDIERFKRNENVLQIGRFSNPPRPGDLDALTVDRDDFDVRHCKVGDCGIRLPADLIRRLQNEIDLQGPDAQVRGAQLFKQILFDHVSTYWAGGVDRMTHYDDGDQPIYPVDAFQGLLNGATAIAAILPGLPAHLVAFPRSRLEEAEDFLYWSKEKFGFAPFITVTHLTIVCRPTQTCVATSKDVYSSRYFDASLGLTIASDDLTDPDASFYLFYANHSRANALKGGMGGLRRSIVERRARGNLEDNLKSIKIRLERER